MSVSNYISCIERRALTITDINDESLCHLATSLKSLESISLEGCYQIGNQGVNAIAHGCPQLYNINLSGCTHVTGILRFLHCNDLYLTYVDIAVHTLFVVSPNLQTVILRKCVELTDNAFTSLPTRTAKSPIRYLDLGEIRNITDKTTQLIGQSCKELSILKLAGKGLTDAGIANIVDGCPDLAELELISCDAITNEAVKSCSRLVSLRVLNISSSRNLTDLAFESDSMSDINDTVEQWPNLQSISLSKCGSITDRTIFFFAKHCPLLTSVDFSFCTLITDKALIEFATSCPNVQDVDLSYCKEITDAAIVEIAKKCSLRKLILAGCVNVTDTALFAVAQSVELQDLDFTLCEKITDEGIVKIAQGCPQLKSISLAECNITDASILALGSAVDGQGSGYAIITFPRFVPY